MTPLNKIQAEIDRLQAKYNRLGNFDKGRLSGLYFAKRMIRESDDYNNWIQTVFDRIESENKGENYGRTKGD